MLNLDDFFFFHKKEVRNATEAHIALMRGSPYVCTQNSTNASQENQHL
jgi:hypothetical protein